MGRVTLADLQFTMNFDGFLGFSAALLSVLLLVREGAVGSGRQPAKPAGAGGAVSRSLSFGTARSARHEELHASIACGV